MLSDHINKDSLQELKGVIDQTTSAKVDYQIEIILEAMWCMNTDWLDIDFNVFDIFN